MDEWSETHTYVDGDWHEGNVPILGPRTHAVWLGSSVFDGARAFDGLVPDLDLHCARVNASAIALGLKPTMSVDDMVALTKVGLKRFESREAVYIRPMYWAERGGYMSVPADPASTRFMLCLHVAEMPASDAAMRLGLSPFRRPTFETMPTDAKAGCLYPNNGRAIMEAKSRGFDNALVRDMLGNVAETGTSNIFLVKDGVVTTPVANGCFLAGITRARVMTLLQDAGMEVREAVVTVADLRAADEVFSTGNYAKVVPVTQFEDVHFQRGPVAAAARERYMAWAQDVAAC